MTPLRVLFVCAADICRSAHMELTGRRSAGHGPSVTFASRVTAAAEEAAHRISSMLLAIVPALVEGGSDG